MRLLNWAMWSSPYDLDDNKTVWEVISDGLDELELGKK